MDNIQISISSCAFPGKSFSEVEEIAKTTEITIEYSSGFPFEDDLPGKFKNASSQRWIHNYFPPPKDPFVLNLASLNDEIWEKSINHGIQGLQLAAAAEAPVYSIHSGFCVDPKTEELGRKIKMPSALPPRSEYWDRFLEGLRRLLREAHKVGVDLLVENNVIIKSNLLPNGDSPFLCSAPDETNRLFNDLGNPRLGLLLDTAHLKVSAQTLGFNRDHFIQVNEPHIKGLHHSDNDGTVDNNKPLPNNYWFLPYMKRFSKFPHTIEVNNLTPEQALGQINLLKGALAR